jgi:hypothetical protein
MPIKLNIPPMAGACRKIQHASERAARDQGTAQIAAKICSKPVGRESDPSSRS